MWAGKYHLVENVRDDVTSRNAFFRFTRRIFPRVGFEEWYLHGYWSDSYRPFSLMKQREIVANISISRMKIWANGTLIQGIQIGTVGTLAEYRGQGLSRQLTEYVLQNHCNDAKIIFLFANDSVLDFYPKFGFVHHLERKFILESGIPLPGKPLRRLDINSHADFSRVEEMMTSRCALTHIFGADDYAFVTSWHILNTFPRDIYLAEGANVIIIATEKAGILDIWDVIARDPISIDSLLPSIVPSSGLKAIKFNFPPDEFVFSYDRVYDDDTGLFILDGSMLPSGDFRYPVTATT